MFLYDYPSIIKDSFVVRINNLFKITDSYYFSDGKSNKMPIDWFFTLSIVIAANFFVIISFEKYAVPLLTRSYRNKKR